MVVVAAIAVTAVRVAEEILKTEDALLAALTAAPVASAPAEYGKLVLITPALATATDVAPETEPRTKTCRPIRV